MGKEARTGEEKSYGDHIAKQCATVDSWTTSISTIA